MISYAGIGGRVLPPGMYDTLFWYGQILGRVGVKLRSGAAPGADTAFERGCDSVSGPKEIFLPWPNFAGHTSTLSSIPTKAFDIAKDVYKFNNWEQTKPTTKRFMARDCMQVTGVSLDDPVDFVVCYTRDGCEHDDDRTHTTGGTGQAISYASTLNIPVFNLYNPAREDDLLDFITQLV